MKAKKMDSGIPEVLNHTWNGKTEKIRQVIKAVLLPNILSISRYKKMIVIIEKKVFAITGARVRSLTIHIKKPLIQKCRLSQTPEYTFGCCSQSHDITVLL